jgi:hypothetical protein
MKGILPLPKVSGTRNDWPTLTGADIHDPTDGSENNSFFLFI